MDDDEEEVEILNVFDARGICWEITIDPKEQTVSLAQYEHCNEKTTTSCWYLHDVEAAIQFLNDEGHMTVPY